jgi:hypothetical protein
MVGGVQAGRRARDGAHPVEILPSDRSPKAEASEDQRLREAELQARAADCVWFWHATSLSARPLPTPPGCDRDVSAQENVRVLTPRTLERSSLPAINAP